MISLTGKESYRLFQAAARKMREEKKEFLNPFVWLRDRKFLSYMSENWMVVSIGKYWLKGPLKFDQQSFMNVMLTFCGKFALQRHPQLKGPLGIEQAKRLHLTYRAQQVIQLHWN